MEQILELLEARIAPASGFVFVDAHTAYTTDSDGDLLTVKITKGTLSDSNFTTTSMGDGYQLELLDLSDATYAGTDLIVTAQRTFSTGGDGFINIGKIDAAGITLGKVSIPGDVGQFEVGDTSTAGGQAIKSLFVGSIGAFGTDTGASADLQTNIFGSIGAMTVATDMHGKFVVNGSTMDGKTGGIGSLTVGGSVIGDADYTGWFQVTGGIKSLKVGGDLSGDGISSGRIQCIYGGVGSVFIGGSLLGGSGANSGQLTANGAIPVSSLVVKGSLIGGAGDYSGSIDINSGIKKTLVGGDFVGGAGLKSGHIYNGDVGTILVRGSLIGGAGQDSGEVEGIFKTVTVMGNVTGGAGQYSGGVYHYDTTVKADVKITGDVTGGTGSNSGAVGYTTSSYSYGSIVIGGSLIGSGYTGAGSIVVDSFNSITIGGSVKGGTGSKLLSGSILAGDNSGTISIGGNLEGGTKDYCGVIDVNGSLKSVTIGGSILGGSGSGKLAGAVLANTTLGSLTVGGDVRGDSSHLVYIAANGLGANLPTSKTTDLAIGKISIGGTSLYGNFLAGYLDNDNGNITGMNGDASIGAVSVGRDWICSTASAGFDAGTDGYFGTDGMNDDFKITSASGRNLISMISSIVIKGQVRGTYGTTGDSYALQAVKLGVLKIGNIDYSKEISISTAATIYLGPVFTMLSDTRALERT